MSRKLRLPKEATTKLKSTTLTRTKACRTDACLSKFVTPSTPTRSTAINAWGLLLRWLYVLASCSGNNHMKRLVLRISLNSGTTITSKQTRYLLHPETPNRYWWWWTCRFITQILVEWWCHYCKGKMNPRTLYTVLRWVFNKLTHPMMLTLC